MTAEKRALRRSRGAYIAEAALEYFIAILVQGTFLAQVTMSLGFTDSQTGIISSLISMGCLFQLASMLLQRRRVKGFVIGMSIANQLLFLLLYAIPLTPLPDAVRRGAFVVLILLAYLLYYTAHPKKIGWLMSLVEDGRRGRFTAVKEMVSLLTGIGFTNAMGLVVDRYKAAGRIQDAFLICALVILALSALHTLMLAICVEPIPTEADPVRKNFFRSFAAVAGQKKIVMAAAVFAIWNLACYCATPFYGTFQLRELALSQKTVAILVSVGSLSRMIVSEPLGSFADRFSFSAMMRLCLTAALLSFLCAALATPATGLLCFLGYYILNGIAMGGISSAMINLVFDYASAAMRSDALAFCQSVSGICGFLATLAASRFVAAMQAGGSRLFGHTVYAQQVTSAAAAVLCGVLIVFLSLAFPGKKKAAA